MFKLAVLGVVVLIAFAVNCEPGDGKDKCMKIFHPHAVKCCKSLNVASFKDDAEECKPDHPPEEKPDNMERPKGPPPCDIDICIAKKMGYLDADGKTINKEAVIAYLKDRADPAIAEAVQKNCLDADLNLYGPPDACDAVKLRHCAQLQVLKGCGEWDTEGKCADVKDNVEPCVAAIGA